MARNTAVKKAYRANVRKLEREMTSIQKLIEDVRKDAGTNPDWKHAGSMGCTAISLEKIRHELENRHSVTD